MCEGEGAYFTGLGVMLLESGLAVCERVGLCVDDGGEMRHDCVLGMSVRVRLRRLFVSEIGCLFVGHSHSLVRRL